MKIHGTGSILVSVRDSIELQNEIQYSFTRDFRTDSRYRFTTGFRTRSGTVSRAIQTAVSEAFQELV
jgi:hypothetical protein